MLDSGDLFTFVIDLFLPPKVEERAFETASEANPLILVELFLTYNVDVKTSAAAVLLPMAFIKIVSLFLVVVLRLLRVVEFISECVSLMISPSPD